MNKAKIAVYTFIGLFVIVILLGVVLFLHNGVPFPH
jgi:hypothetical protein